MPHLAIEFQVVGQRDDFSVDAGPDKALFQQVLEQVAAETGASYVDNLRDDDLPGAPGDPGHSYIGLMVQNMRIMIPALGGSAEAFDLVDMTPVFDGVTNVRYPQ